LFVVCYLDAQRQAWTSVQACYFFRRTEQWEASGRFGVVIRIGGCEAQPTVKRGPGTDDGAEDGGAEGDESGHLAIAYIRHIRHTEKEAGAGPERRTSERRED
jgi:hypothetical protein